MKTREDFETAEEYVAYLEEQNAALRTKAIAGNSLRMKVSAKGAMSIYGFGRFPFTMYKEQWLRLFAHANEIIAFLKEHDAELAEKKAA